MDAGGGLVDFKLYTANGSGVAIIPGPLCIEVAQAGKPHSRITCIMHCSCSGKKGRRLGRRELQQAAWNHRTIC